MKKFIAITISLFYLTVAACSSVDMKVYSAKYTPGDSLRGTLDITVDQGSYEALSRTGAALYANVFACSSGRPAAKAYALVSREPVTKNEDKITLRFSIFRAPDGALCAYLNSGGYWPRSFESKNFKVDRALQED